MAGEANALASAIVALTAAREPDQLISRLRQAQLRGGPLSAERAAATAAAALPALDRQAHSLGVCFVLEAQARALAPRPPPPPPAAGAAAGAAGPGAQEDGDHPMGGGGGATDGDGDAAAALLLAAGGAAAPVPVQPQSPAAEAFVQYASAFFRECAADQIRAAPDVCECC
jgi:hypothetical protein